MDCLWCEINNRPPKEAVVTVIMGIDQMMVCKECQRDIIILVDTYTAEEEFDQAPLPEEDYGLYL